MKITAATAAATASGAALIKMIHSSKRKNMTTYAANMTLHYEVITIKAIKQFVGRTKY